MDLAQILPLLGNLGAPLSVSIMLFYLMHRQQKSMDQALSRALTIIERLAGVECPDLPASANERLPAALDELEHTIEANADSETRPVPMPPAPVRAVD